MKAKTVVSDVDVRDTHVIHDVPQVHVVTITMLDAVAKLPIGKNYDANQKKYAARKVVNAYRAFLSNPKAGDYMAKVVTAFEKRFTAQVIFA